MQPFPKIRTLSHYSLIGLLFWGPVGWAGDKIACDQAGPQAPRDIQNPAGTNAIRFSKAPPASEMHLCDIHFHKYAEHRASGYTELAGKGDHRGYICNGSHPVVNTSQGHGEGHSHQANGCPGIAPGDTIEVHWVFTTCDVAPAPSLGSCFSEACRNPELRVEARVFLLTDDGSGENFLDYRAGTGKLPKALEPVEYIGSTTGPGYNDGTCSPYQVTWRVSSACTPLEISSVQFWCETDHNPFHENHAHGVRRLVKDPALLAPIKD